MAYLYGQNYSVLGSAYPHLANASPMEAHYATGFQVDKRHTSKLSASVSSVAAPVDTGSCLYVGYDYNFVGQKTTSALVQPQPSELRNGGTTGQTTHFPAVYQQPTPPPSAVASYGTVRYSSDRTEQRITRENGPNTTLVLEHHTSQETSKNDTEAAKAARGRKARRLRDCNQMVVVRDRVSRILDFRPIHVPTRDDSFPSRTPMTIIPIPPVDRTNKGDKIPAHETYVEKADAVNRAIMQQRYYVESASEYESSQVDDTDHWQSCEERRMRALEPCLSGSELTNGGEQGWWNTEDWIETYKSHGSDSGLPHYHG
ncbi:hypothetical protein CERSUDRAFT_125960 [Gelatoporia subvermispora B]|uniref:Uncharacterized protein n=1 Tax=Ceriporiopsis subvermispora (strain B) TaxID=914234 RepID=M2QNG3_CERS8|nr:hypothetical protein CERSUDRAFT_125960 [Gelatoporia subvermispora B]